MLAKLCIVGVRHVRETRTETIVVGAHQRILALQVDMVANDHQRTPAVVRIDPTGSVGQDNRLQAHPTKRANRERHLLRGVALVEMHAPLHGSDRDAGNGPDHQRSRMAHRGAAREERNIPIRNADAVFEFVREATEPGAEYQSNARPQSGASQDELCRLFSTSELGGVEVGGHCHFPISSRYFSTCKAAMHPVPAAVTPCRYWRSATPPETKTPGTLVQTCPSEGRRYPSPSRLSWSPTKPALGVCPMPRNMALVGKSHCSPVFKLRKRSPVTSCLLASYTSSTTVSVRNSIFGFSRARSSMIFEARNSLRR